MWLQVSIWSNSRKTKMTLCWKNTKPTMYWYYRPDDPQKTRKPTRSSSKGLQKSEPECKKERQSFRSISLRS